MAYTNKPLSNTIPFKFTSTGYTKPSYSSISFNFGTKGFADLKSAVNVLSLYTNTTYSYLKECPTIIVGYKNDVPQILNLSCVYGGIRDISGAVHINPIHSDLKAQIVIHIGIDDLSAYIKSATQASKNLGASIVGYPPRDLSAFIHGWDYRFLNASLYAWTPRDLSSYIGTHPPADLPSIMNLIEIDNIPANIYADWWHGQLDLNTEFYKIFYRGRINLKGIIHGWDTLDLSGNINTVYKLDLKALIAPTRGINLPTSIFSVAPSDLSAFIHSYDTRNLSAGLIGVYGPYDIQAFINASGGFINLPAHLQSMHGVGVISNLSASVSGWGRLDLSAFISTIKADDLGGIVNVTGKSLDLTAYIIPRTLRIKKALLVSLLEHRDLYAIINFQCFVSTFRSLPASMYLLYKKDLRAFIFGWNNADGFANLGAYINAENYLVEDTHNINLFAEQAQSKFALLDIKFNTTSSYTTFDTINVVYSGKDRINLGAYLNVVLTSKNLSATLNPITQTNYSELPDYVNPKTHEIVIDFNDKWQEIWRKNVEILFSKDGSKPYHYFYVSGTNKVYKVDRSRHWTIWANSYIETTNDMIERRNVRSKFIFKLSNYKTIDEAIRDIIDRATFYRRTNLNASINAIIDYDHIADLNSSIITKPGFKTWAKYLIASLTVTHPSTDLSASVDLIPLNYSLHFTNSGYVPDDGDNVTLNFE